MKKKQLNADEDHRPTGRLLTLEEFGEATNTGRRFARRLVQERRISFVKLGKHIRIPESEMLRFIADGQVESIQ